MSVKEKFKSTTMLIDTYLLLAVGFVSLFVIAFLLIRPTIDPASDIELDEQLLVKLRWDPKRTNDMDLWIRDPNDIIVSYMNKEQATMTLERDDRGIGTEVVNVNGVEKPIFDNVEVIRIKQLIDGTYYINVHFYSDNGCECHRQPVEVEVFDGIKHKQLAVYTNDVLIYGESPILEFEVTDGKIVRYGPSEELFIIKARTDSGRSPYPYSSSPTSQVNHTRFGG